MPLLSRWLDKNWKKYQFIYNHSNNKLYTRNLKEKKMKYLSQRLNKCDLFLNNSLIASCNSYCNDFDHIEIKMWMNLDLDYGTVNNVKLIVIYIYTNKKITQCRKIKVNRRNDKSYGFCYSILVWFHYSIKCKDTTDNNIVSEFPMTFNIEIAKLSCEENNETFLENEFTVYSLILAWWFCFSF